LTQFAATESGWITLNPDNPFRNTLSRKSLREFCFPILRNLLG
jgi:hypothetical protein